MFISGRHSVLSIRRERARQRWSLLALFALLASFFVAIATPPPPARAEFNFDCTSEQGIAYFVNTNAGTVSMVYTGTDTAVRTIDVGGTPYGVASLPDGSKIYVANGSGSVQVIDPTTLAVSSISDPSFSESVGAWSSQDGSQVYITNYGTNTVSVIDTASDTVTRVVTVGDAAIPTGSGWMDQYGSELFVSLSAGSAGIAVIDMNSTSSTASRIIPSALSHAVAVNGTFLASADQRTTIEIYGTAAPSPLLRTITAPEDVHGLTFVPNTNYLIATGTATGNSYVYDASTGALLRTLDGGGDNARIAVASPIGDEVYIASSTGGAARTGGTMDHLVTVGTPDQWVFTPNQTALGAFPDGHTPAFSCLPPLTGSKAFAKSPIAMGETTTLTITINNTNIVPETGITGVTLTDPLPSNIRVAPTGTASTTCTGGTVTADPGGATVTLTGGTVAPATGPNGSLTPGSCTITIPVIGVEPGSQTNVIPAGGLIGDIVGPNTSEITAPIEVLPPGLQIAKTNDDADGIVEGGQTVTYSVTVTNSGTIPQTGITLDDVLPEGVTYVPQSTVATQGTITLDNEPGGATPDLVGGDPVAGSLVSPDDDFTIPVGESMTVTYQVTVDTPAPSTITDYTNTASVSSVQEPTPIEDSNTLNPFRALSVEKETSMTADSRPGDTVTYTVTATNDGNIAYTDANPAVVYDDVRGIIDDATYNGDAAASVGDAPTYIDPGFLSWRGPLGVGESVTITYTVVLQAGGDGVVRNVAWQPANPPAPNTPPADGDVPACDPRTDQGTDPVSGEPCDATQEELPRLTIEKTPNVTELPADGGSVTYTIVVTNAGPGDFTANSPATFADDLTEVLDDAEYNDDASATIGTVSYAAPELSWSGVLASGQSATIVYTVTYDAAAGDNILFNTVCVPEADALDPAAACDQAQVPAAELEMSKTVDPADGTAVNAGQAVTYTLSFANVGQAPATVDALDSLAGVLDDATLTAGPTASAGLTATLAGTDLGITGTVPVGQTLTVTYTVTVNPFAQQADHVLDNVLSNGDGTCPPGGCDDTENPIRHYSVAKEVSAAQAMPGDVVTYTVTVTNDGEVDYTAAAPASIEDDLTAVLDDAVYNDDATQGATVTGNTLSWSGPLAIGDTVTITYSVTVDAAGEGGDLALGNVVVPTDPSGECATADDCTTDTPVGVFEVSKTSSGTGQVRAGDVLTYTVTVTNPSAVDFTDAQPASFTDDLSPVLDDATYNDDATQGATVEGTMLSWSGPLAAGATVTVTYSVTVDDAGDGDGVLTNAVVPGEDGTCVNACTTEDALRAYTVAKTSSAGGTVHVGDTVTYTVTVTNTGAVDFTDADPAALSDDLAPVLDDATYNGDATNGAVVSGTVLTWSGAVAAGDSLDITYSVTVLATGTGDGVLTNAVVATTPDGDCDPDAECTTVDELAAFTVEKSASATRLSLGDVLTYTIVVTNTGAADYTVDSPAVVTDDLSEVIDDATYNGDATNTAVYSAPELTWSLAIPAGESTVLTYSVTVNDPDTGDHLLTNAVVPGDGGECVTEGSCATVTPVAEYAVAKSVDKATARAGDDVTYTVTVTNTGAVDFTSDSPASFVDDLSAVLDDAAYNGDATNGATYSRPVLSWSGALDQGQTVQVTYSVSVNSPLTGDHRLDNTVVPGTDGRCGDACSTNTTVDVPPPSPLATTGLNPAVVGGGIAAAVLAMLAGLGLILFRRRTHVGE
ncbi:hypothetical protein [Microbacterium paraoxydans]|uniref:DUF7927 domain-containing protein n=1 Tax=Microbacterium paraoxydans TaxID=199592 RepID=UPI003D70E02C